MPDGVRLATDIFLPTEGPRNGPFPVAFSYTAYNRSVVDMKTGKQYDETLIPFCPPM